MRPLRLLHDAHPDRPGFDTAVSHALLVQAAAGDAPETFRLYRPAAILSFGRLDATRPGYPAAVRIAHDAGFTPVRRLAGGRAAVFHETTLAFAHTVPGPAPERTTTVRFAATADLIRAALRRLGVEARVGAVPGEYCPGAWSVNARGAVKLAGVGQRLLGTGGGRGGAAHVGGVVVAAGADRVRGVLTPVYAALELPWDPGTCGSVAAELGRSGAAAGLADAVADAMIAELADRYDLWQGGLDHSTRTLAATLASQHEIAA